MKKLFIPILVVGILWSCDDRSSNVSDEFKRQARGDADELILVIDSAVYAGPVGDELRKTFEAPMLGMPQDEPLLRNDRSHKTRSL